jgi:hypothetical protein
MFAALGRTGSRKRQEGSCVPLLAREDAYGLQLEKRDLSMENPQAVSQP